MQRLRHIEKEMHELFQTNKVYENDAPEDYSSLSHEDKNAGKFFATFPFPYMNGYLHLGKSI
jgi:leucyl-tRNA synthetase